jgi:hypothetical protein
VVIKFKRLWQFGRFSGEAEVGRIIEVEMASPMLISVVDGAGRRAGGDEHGEYQEIAGSFYSGRKSHPQTIRFPSTCPSSYDLVMAGIGEGEFHLALRLFEADDLLEERRFEGVASEGIKMWSSFAVVGEAGPGEVLSIRYDETAFLRGDVNGDGGINLADAIKILMVLFSDEPGFECAAAADANGSDGVGISDCIYLLEFFFLNGQAPPRPYPYCGLDPAGDSAGDCQYDPAACR